MLPERKIDRVFYLGVIPVLAGVIGSVVGALMQAQSCSVVGATEIKSLLENAQLNGQQKIQFMQDYLQLTDRPWVLARNVVTFLTFTGSAMVGLFIASGGFKRR